MSVSLMGMPVHFSNTGASRSRSYITKSQTMRQFRVFTTSWPMRTKSGVLSQVSSFRISAEADQNRVWEAKSDVARVRPMEAHPLMFTPDSSMPAIWMAK